MPTGSFDLSYLAPGISSIGLQTGVFFYTAPPEGEDGGSYSQIPNVQWLRIDYREGPFPPTAEFKYIQDDALAANMGWPSQFEQLWPIDTPHGQYTVQNDDRIVVLALNPDNTTNVLFDGFAQVPQVDVTPQNQNVSFAAVDVSVRCWDQPIVGRRQRDSDPVGINTTGGADRNIDLPTRFNPSDTSVADGNKGGYIPNCSPDGHDSSGVLGDYPVFIDPGIEVSPDPRTYWDVGKAIKYILEIYNADEEYVSNPTFDTIDDLVQSEYPPDDGDIYDPTDASTSPIVIRDLDAANRPWPEVIAELLSYAGFVLRFDTETASNGTDPAHYLRIYRRDAAAAVAPKRVFLDQGAPSSTRRPTTSRSSTSLAIATRSPTPGRSRPRKSGSRCR